MMKRNPRKKKESGYTFAEMLLAILILLMVSTIVAAGIPSAKNAYEKVVLASNAEVLLSTTVSTLRNELGTAKDIVIKDGKEVAYYNAQRKAPSRIYVTGSDIMLQRYYFPDGLGTNSTVEQLISSQAATANLHVRYDSVTYSEGVIVFNNLAVYRGDETTPLVQWGKTEKELSIRVILD